VFLGNMKISLPYERPKIRESLLKFISSLKAGYQINYEQQYRSGPAKFTGPRVLQKVTDFSQFIP